MTRGMFLGTVVILAFITGGACQGMQMSHEEEEMLEEMGVKGTPMGRKDQTPKAEVVQSDVKYIRCDVCRTVVEKVLREGERLLSKRFEYKSKRKNEFVDFDGEGAVQDFIERVCVADKADGPGEWIKKVDLVARGERLQLEEQPDFGHCEQECRTVERACEEVVDAADTDFSEVVYAAVRDKTDLEKVQRQICNRVTGFCKTKAPALDGSKRKDYPFRAMTADEKQMADMCAPRGRAPAFRIPHSCAPCTCRMANLKESGMGGTMYRREDLMQGMDGMKEAFGDMMGGADDGEDGSAKEEL